MFLRGKKWINIRKRISSIISCISCFFLSLIFALYSVSGEAYAISLQPDEYNVRFSTAAGGPSWHSYEANERIGIQYLYNYEWIIDSMNITGNYANVHFETNIVIPGTPTNDQSLSRRYGRFHNTGFLDVAYCGSSGSNVQIRSKDISSVQTEWFGTTPGIAAKSNNLTLTIYGDVVLSGLSSGTHDLYCNVGLSNGWAFVAYRPGDYGNGISVYFEQQPTRINFTTDNSEAMQWEQINAISSINQGEQERWETERQEQNEKEAELNDQSSDLSLSASVTSNPFTDLFLSNPFSVSTCFTTQSIHALFNVSAWTICSPFRQPLINILTYGNSLLVTALLIRLYYKKLKGGVDG